ncbi:MAG: tRNA preQ1(34) S-adenosylmethionine ribosyltransferase-isomerase QueA [Deinococcales bacterium]
MPNGLELNDYDYVLPPERIAQIGAEPRDASKLLIVRRGGKVFEHKIFREITEYLNSGDVLVINQTEVIPARLTARKPTGATLEVLLLRELEHFSWSAYLKPAKRVALGGILEFGGVQATVEQILKDGARVLRFSEDIKPHLASLGAIPLPPYIEDSAKARARYQTIYAKDAGSIAAPTAGLHFTAELLERVRQLGVQLCPLTLHVGAGTFKPVLNSIENHVMHAEPFFVPPETAHAVSRAKLEGRRIVAVGTTSVRALETAWDGSVLRAGAQESTLFIRPPQTLQVVDAMITNFHLPRSTLLMLVASFAGFQTMRAAYQTALESGYRFYSLGDAMLIY